jgi:hypothetical protein
VVFGIFIFKLEARSRKHKAFKNIEEYPYLCLSALAIGADTGLVTKA